MQVAVHHGLSCGHWDRPARRHVVRYRILALPHFWPDGMQPDEMIGQLKPHKLHLTRNMALDNLPGRIRKITGRHTRCDTSY